MNYNNTWTFLYYLKYLKFACCIQTFASDCILIEHSLKVLNYIQLLILINYYRSTSISKKL